MFLALGFPLRSWSKWLDSLGLIPTLDKRKKMDGWIDRWMTTVFLCICFCNGTNFHHLQTFL